MIIRATAKLHSIARIKPVKKDASMSESLPGEWYASLLSTGRKGGSAIHFLHNSTMISILVLGRSLTRVLDVLPVRVAGLLSRNGFSELIPGFELFTVPEILTTNSRSMLANMIQMKWDLEYNLALSEELDPSDINHLEDKYLKYLIGGKIARAESNDYIRPVDQLKKLLFGQA
jgi:hypothetical protein